MSWLRGTVRLEFLNNSARLAKLLTPLSYESENYIWNAPAKMIFDGASIPRIFWWLIGSPFTGHYRRWAVMHDAYYKRHRSRTRKQVDKQFQLGMIEDGVHPFKAWLIYLAVRLGGRNSWEDKDG